jgi:hypothetical protein
VKIPGWPKLFGYFIFFFVIRLIFLNQMVANFNAIYFFRILIPLSFSCMIYNAISFFKRVATTDPLKIVIGYPAQVWVYPISHNSYFLIIITHFLRYFPSIASPDTIYMQNLPELFFISYFNIFHWGDTPPHLPTVTYLDMTFTTLCNYGLKVAILDN